MLEWLDGLSLWWHAAGAIFIFAVWMAYEVVHAPVMEEDEPEQRGHNSANK